ncbi:MAG: hypothetical protein J0H74_21960 [Chitinophagaceae bacterium]|nr:hypothetical protein [Chitinophagaceae bacterium]
MKKLTKLLPLAACISFFALPSCQKITDYIHDHPNAHDSLCRVTSIGIKGFYGNSDAYIVYYNAKGDPDSLIDNNPVGEIGNSRYFFRYDNSARLSDFMWAETISSGMPWFAIEWHKYIYVQPDYIIDTTMTYVGDVRLPAPPATGAAYYTITAFTLDGQNRIIKQWSIKDPNDPPHAPVLTKTFAYDIRGNQVLSDPGLTYDNRANVYRTNRVWQFLYNDYSINNVIKADGSYAPSYNEFGLPLNLPNLNSHGIRLFGLYNTDSTANISYACSGPVGPIDY